jgi:hypothetical protein
MLQLFSRHEIEPAVREHRADRHAPRLYLLGSILVHLDSPPGVLGGSRVGVSWMECAAEVHG